MFLGSCQLTEEMGKLQRVIILVCNFTSGIISAVEKISGNIFNVFQEVCQKYSEKDVILFKGKDNYTSITYQELYVKTLRIADILKKKGIKNKDHIVIFLENTPMWPVVFLSLMQIGAIAIPLNPHLDTEELKKFLCYSQPTLILTSFKLSSRIEEVAKDIKGKIITLDKAILSEEKINSSPIDTNNISGDDTALIVYTSGTTSSAKGVVLTHKNLLSNINSLKQLKLINPNDCLISILPFYHTYPFTVNLLLPILSGAKISFPISLDIEHIMECIRNTKVTILIGVPRLFALLWEGIKSKLEKTSFIKRIILNIVLCINFPLRKYLHINLAKIALKELHKNFGGSFRFMISGGAKLNSKTALSLYKLGFTILEGYGLTEASPVVTFNLPHKFKIGSVGKSIPNVDIKIDEPDNNGIGEILIKGSNVCAGYYQQKGEFYSAAQNGWLHTGDIGYIDKEGFLYIVGRKKEMLVLSSGKKINPAELESYYQKSHYIKEICIFLSPSQEAKDKDILSAVILPNYESLRLHQIKQVKDKIRWEIEKLSRNLPSYKRIKKYLIISEPLPKTILGKIKRYEVENKYRYVQGEKRLTPKLTPEDEKLYLSPICQKALDYISQKLQRPVNLDDHLELDLGLDSLEQISLFLEFQKLMQINVDEQAFLEVFTVRDVLNKLNEFSEEKYKERRLLNWQESLASPFERRIKQSVVLNLSLLGKAINIILWIILKFISCTFFSLKVKGKDNIPKKGPFILCPNHSSYLDGPILASSLNLPLLLNTYFLGYTAYFKHPLVWWARKLLRLIPIDASSNLTESLRICSYILNNSKILCIFPEGMRSLNGEIKDFKRGVGILIKELDVVAVPVYTRGTYQAWPPHKTLPKPNKVTIIFGEKLSLKKLTTKLQVDVDIYKNIVDNLRDELLRLKYLLERGET